MDRELADLGAQFQALNIGAPRLYAPARRAIQPTSDVPFTMADTTRHIAKTELDSKKLAAEQAQLMTQIVHALGRAAPIEVINEIKQQTIEHAEKALRVKMEALNDEHNLKRSDQLASKYQKKPKLPARYPRHASPKNLEAKNVIAACGTYDPAKPDDDFAKVWENLLYMGNDNAFQPRDYMLALSYVLKGDAKEVFNYCRGLDDNTLEHTVDRLYSAFAKQRTVTEDRQALENFKRRPNEYLTTCMARADIQLDKLRPFHPPEAWPATREVHRRNILFKVLNEKTRKTIRFQEDNAIQANGMAPDVEKLIRAADAHERRFDLIPKTEVHADIHCARAKLQPREFYESEEEDYGDSDEEEDYRHYQEDYQSVKEDLDEVKNLLYNMHVRPYIIGANAGEEKIGYDFKMRDPTQKREAKRPRVEDEDEINKENVNKVTWAPRKSRPHFKRPYKPNMEEKPFNTPRPPKISEPLYTQWTPNKLTPKTEYYDKKNELVLKTAKRNLSDSFARQARGYIKDNRVRTPTTSLDRQVREEKAKGTRNIIINWDGREYKIGPENEVKRQGTSPYKGKYYTPEEKAKYYKNKENFYKGN